MKHFKFNSFGADRAPEAPVVAVDVQLEQLVVLCEGNQGQGKRAGSQMVCSALFHAPTQSSSISVWPMCETLHSHRTPPQEDLSVSHRGVSLCHSECHPHLTGTETKPNHCELTARYWRA